MTTAYGRDRETVRQLYEHRAELRIPEETRALIELYEEAWRERAIEPPAPKRGALRVDGLRDILANKLSALVDRNEPKDFADVYCLLERAGLSLEQGVADAKAKFGWPALELLLEILRLDRMGGWPELDPPVDIEMARHAFRPWAKSLIRLDDEGSD